MAVVINAKCWLRFQHCDIRHGDDVILSAISNGPYGSTVGVFQEDDGPLDAAGNPLGQSYLRMIGTLDQRDSERINFTSRAQQFGGRPRGGPRVGSRFCPDIESAVIAPTSPQYFGANAYPPDFGRLPPGGMTRRPYVLVRVVCRT
jgi:hypothetical protein